MTETPLNSHHIDLVADVGEGFGQYSLTDDEEILDAISAANIACGFHAGDPRTIDHVISLCVEKAVLIGAHPSFRDLQGFGRRAMQVDPDELEADLVYQIGAIQAFAQRHGGRLNHVTLHGALGNMACERRDYAESVVRAVQSCDPELKLFVWAGELLDVCKKHSIPYKVIGFADRAYNENGTLVPRKLAGSVIHNDDEVVDRVVKMATEGRVVSAAGKEIALNCEAILLHGDTPESVALSKRVNNVLNNF